MFFFYNMFKLRSLIKQYCNNREIYEKNEETEGKEEESEEKEEESKENEEEEEEDNEYLNSIIKKGISLLVLTVFALVLI